MVINRNNTTKIAKLHHQFQIAKNTSKASGKYNFIKAHLKMVLQNCYVCKLDKYSLQLMSQIYLVDLSNEPSGLSGPTDTLKLIFGIPFV